jgi:hypothetical protein
VTWLLVSAGGLLASAGLLLFGLRVGDRWLAMVAGVATCAFAGAVVLYGRDV